jgi:hypothetical protein
MILPDRLATYTRNLIYLSQFRVTIYGRQRKSCKNRDSAEICRLDHYLILSLMRVSELKFCIHKVKNRLTEIYPRIIELSPLRLA